jgi:hypothetical protein
MSSFTRSASTCWVRVATILGQDADAVPSGTRLVLIAMFPLAELIDCDRSSYGQRVGIFAGWLCDRAASFLAGDSRSVGTEPSAERTGVERAVCRVSVSCSSSEQVNSAPKLLLPLNQRQKL